MRSLFLQWEQPETEYPLGQVSEFLYRGVTSSGAGVLYLGYDGGSVDTETFKEVSRRIPSRRVSSVGPEGVFESVCGQVV